MFRCLPLIVALAMLSNPGCGQPDDPPSPAESGSVQPVGVGEDPPAATDVSQVDVPSQLDPAISRFVDQTEQRINEHVIQIAGLKFLGDAYFDPALVEQLEGKLAQAQAQIRQFSTATDSQIDVIRAQVTRLLSEMDRLYEMAMAATAHGYRDDSAPTDQGLISGDHDPEPRGSDPRDAFEVDRDPG